MSERYEYGIVADERQQLDHYKAAYKAFTMMLYGTMLLGAVFIVLREDLLAIVCGVVAVAGIAVRQHSLEKSGWADYVKEQIASIPEVRRRAWRSVAIRGGALAAIWFLGHYTPGESFIVRELSFAVAYGGLISVAYWWFEIRAALRPQRRMEMEQGSR